MLNALFKEVFAELREVKAELMQIKDSIKELQQPDLTPVLEAILKFEDKLIGEELPVVEVADSTVELVDSIPVG